MRIHRDSFVDWLAFRIHGNRVSFHLCPIQPNRWNSASVPWKASPPIIATIAGNLRTRRDLLSFSNFVSTAGVKRPLPDDFRDFLSLLNERGVEYLVVGGWAVGVHGYPRATGDIDVRIAVSEENVDRLMDALYAFGAPADIPRGFFFERGNVFRMGRTPMKIEVVTSASGVVFGQGYDRRKEVTIGDLVIPFIGFDDLIV